MHCHLEEWKKAITLCNNGLRIDDKHPKLLYYKGKITQGVSVTVAMLNYGVSHTKSLETFESGYNISMNA